LRAAVFHSCEQTFNIVSRHEEQDAFTPAPELDLEARNAFLNEIFSRQFDRHMLVYVAERHVRRSTVFCFAFHDREWKCAATSERDSVQEREVIEFCTDGPFDLCADSLPARRSGRAKSCFMTTRIRKLWSDENLRTGMKVFRQREIVMYSNGVVGRATGQAQRADESDESSQSDSILHGIRIGWSPPRLESRQRSPIRTAREPVTALGSVLIGLGCCSGCCG
jgi:hypothetical protein